MKNMLRSWVVRGLLICSLITAPWAAMAVINFIGNPNGGAGWLDSASATGNQILSFVNGRVVQTASTQGNGAMNWAFDEKEYVLTLADIGTLSDATFVVPETGVIMEISVAWNVTLASANAVMTAWRVPNGSPGKNSTQITAFSASAATTQTGGGTVTDDTIYQSVNRGDLIAIQTDGGPSTATPAGITIRIRAPSL